MTDIDVELKRVFDDRLEPMKPPPPARPRTGRRLRIAAAAATATVVIAGAGLAIDVNSVAAANGVDCAGFLTKLHVWAQGHRGDLVGMDHSAAKAELAKMVSESGCAPHDATHDASHTGSHH